MIVCVVGPTGVGKTKLSEVLSLKYDAVVVNCDAMQVYKEMDIGTAKYTSSEDLGQPHELFDIVSPDEMYTVYDYQKDFRRVLDKYKNRNVVVVGGTGLYLKAGLYNYEFDERSAEEMYEGYTNEELYDLVIAKYGKTDVHVNNRRRLISRLNSSKNNSLKDELLYDDVYVVGLTTDRENLYARIDDRVDEMMKMGLLDEVKDLYAKFGMTKAMKTGIGYKEVIAYLNGLMTREEMVRLVKQRSRKYAKRQYTWFNRQMHVNWFETDYQNFDNTVDEVIRFLNTR